MATDIYFFTDPTKLEAQTSLEAFGDNADPAAANRAYNLASVHRAKANEYPPVYAVTNGLLRVIEERDNADVLLPTVTLILYPDLKCQHILPKIKYFVYRGVLKSSLYDTTKEDRILGHSAASGIAQAGSPLNSLPGMPAEGYSNDLTREIVQVWNDRFPDNPAQLPPTKFSLGTNKNAQLTDGAWANAKKVPIDHLFFNDFLATGTGAFEPFQEVYPIAAGNEIGRFNGGSAGFGFEIVLDAVRYCPLVENFSYTTNGYRHLVSQSAANNFSILTKKQEILHYLDPSAFYGAIGTQIAPAGEYKLLYRTNIGIENTSNVIFNTDDAYSFLLSGESFGLANTDGNSLFFNRNKIYIDIRDNYGNSYNYYKQLFHNPDPSLLDLMLSFADSDSNSPGDMKEYSNADQRGWPLLRINNNTSGFIRLAFPSPQIRNTARDYHFVSFFNPAFTPNADLHTGILETINRDAAISPGIYFDQGYTLTHKLKSGASISTYLKMSFIQECNLIDDQYASDNDLKPITPNAVGFPTNPVYELEKQYMRFAFPVDFNLGFRKKTGSEEKLLLNKTIEHACFIENHAVTGKCFMADIGMAFDYIDDIEQVTFYAYPHGLASSPNASGILKKTKIGNYAFAQEIEAVTPGDNFRFVQANEAGTFLSESLYEVVDRYNRTSNFISFRFKRSLLIDALNTYQTKFKAFISTDSPD